MSKGFANGVRHVLVNPTSDYAVEALARVLAAQAGYIRLDSDITSYDKMPDEARHAFRELALAYAGVVRDADIAQDAQEAADVGG